MYDFIQNIVIDKLIIQITTDFSACVFTVNALILVLILMQTLKYTLLRNDATLLKSLISIEIMILIKIWLIHVKMQKIGEFHQIWFHQIDYNFLSCFGTFFAKIWWSSPIFCIFWYFCYKNLPKYCQLVKIVRFTL